MRTRLVCALLGLALVAGDPAGTLAQKYYSNGPAGYYGSGSYGGYLIWGPHYGLSPWGYANPSSRYFIGNSYGPPDTYYPEYSTPYYTYGSASPPFQGYYGYASPPYQSYYYAPLPYAPSSQPPSGPARTVTVDDAGFAPKQLEITLGTTVTWTNKGQEVHNLAQPFRNWKSLDLSPGQSYTWTFTQPGSYELLCSHHPGMKMTVVVK